MNRGDNRIIPSTQQHAGRHTTVPVATLDRVLNREGAVLKGMNELLASPNPPWIHLEVCPHLLREAGSSFEEIHGILNQHGYSLRQADARQDPLDLDRVARLEGALGYANVLAVPPARDARDAVS